MPDTAVAQTPDLAGRLSRMAAAIDAEVAFIKKDSGEQKLELTSGQRDGRSHGHGGVYVFLLAEAGMPLPDDAAGTLSMGSAEVKAYVVAHEGNQLWVRP